MKKDDLRTRSSDVLGKLIKTKGAEALPDVLAWEREFITAFPREKIVGVIDDKEAAFAVPHARHLDPNFTLALPSTFLLDDGSLGATVFTHAVRLHRLQPTNLKPKSNAGRPPFDDDHIEASAERIMAAQRQKNQTKAITQALESLNPRLDPEEEERALWRVDKKLRERLRKK